MLLSANDYHDSSLRPNGGNATTPKETHRMAYFFMISSAVLLAVHSYLFWKLRQWLGGRIWQLPVLLLFALMLVMLIFRRELFAQIPPFVSNFNFIWLGFILLAFGVFLALDLLTLLAYLAKWVSGFDLTGLLAPSRRIPLGLALSVCLAAYSLWSAQNVRVNVHEIATAKLPSGVERVRVVQLSDIHLSESTGAADLRKIDAKVRELAPDIIAFTGDLVDTDMENRAEEALILRDLPASSGKYAVMGNHEYYRGLANSRAFMRRSGLEILENQAVADKSGIIVVGVDDPVMPRKPEDPADLATLLKRQDQSRFILLLKHRPYVEPEETGLFDLQLSGHTHGGQIWPGTILAKRFNRNVEQGLTELVSGAGRSLLYVSNGTGYWGPPMRFMAPPEIAVFDLVRK